MIVCTTRCIKLEYWFYWFIKEKYNYGRNNYASSSSLLPPVGITDLGGSCPTARSTSCNLETSYGASQLAYYVAFKKLSFATSLNKVKKIKQFFTLL